MGDKILCNVTVVIKAHITHFFLSTDCGLLLIHHYNNRTFMNIAHSTHGQLEAGGPLVAHMNTFMGPPSKQTAYGQKKYIIHKQKRSDWIRSHNGCRRCVFCVRLRWLNVIKWPPNAHRLPTPFLRWMKCGRVATSSWSRVTAADN
jgi:hypothetical protein